MLQFYINNQYKKLDCIMGKIVFFVWYALSNVSFKSHGIFNLHRHLRKEQHTYYRQNYLSSFNIWQLTTTGNSSWNTYFWLYVYCHLCTQTHRLTYTQIPVNKSLNKEGNKLRTHTSKLLSTFLCRNCKIILAFTLMFLRRYFAIILINISLSCCIVFPYLPYITQQEIIS